MYAAWLGRLFVFFLQTAACFLRVEVVKVIWDIFVNTHEFSPIQKRPLVVFFWVFFSSTSFSQAFHLVHNRLPGLFFDLNKSEGDS